MTESHGYLTGVGGLRLFYRAWEVLEPRAALLVVHGLGEHSGRYGASARAFNDAGFSTYALDMRGHGRSDGRRGHVRAFEHLLQDVDRLRRRVCSSKGECPVFLLGHSLGGLVTLRYLQEYGCPSLRGAVLVAPFVRVAARVPGWKLTVARVADRVAPALSLDNGLDGETLFRSESARAAYRDDPFVHHRISARLWSEMLRNASLLAEGEGRIGVPLLVQLPGDDRVVDAEAARVTARRCAESCEVRTYPEAYHALYHDLEGGRGPTDAASWLCGQVAPSAVERSANI